MKRLFLFLMVFLTFNSLFAQQKVKIKKDLFFTSETNFKDSWKSMRKGNLLFRQNQLGSFIGAIDYLKKAIDYNPDYAALNYELGVCYIKAHDHVNGLKYINEAFMIDPNVAYDIHFWIGRAYHLNSKFDLAVTEYQTFLDGLSDKQRPKYETQVNQYINQCKSGIALVKNLSPAIISNLGENVNTQFPEYSPVFASYDSIVFFASRRPNTTGGKLNAKVSNEYFEDIYYTNALNGDWQAPAQFPKPVNSKGNDAPVAVNQSGDGLLIYRGNEGNGDIYITFRKEKGNGKIIWSKPKQVIKKINRKKSRETALTFNHDSTEVYFVSNKKGGQGGKDIWVSHRRGNSLNGWTKPENLGASINSPYDEESVFLLPNDSVLYFASQGHNSIGGYDIFKVNKLPDGRWTEPINLGIPFNTPDDDMSIFVNKDKRTGYFASNGRKDTYGDFDLYTYFIYRPKPMKGNFDDDLIAYQKSPVNELYMEEPVAIKTMRMTVVKGVITEYQTNKPLAAKIEIVDNATQKVIQTILTNATTGDYTVMLPSGKDYGFAVVADKYMFYSENFNIPEATGYQEITKNIQLLPVNPGSHVVLKNVFFDVGKSTLRPESYAELQRIADAFKSYPKMVIEISGFTDSRGNASTNLKLSQARAQSVVNYLISIGVPSNQLIAKGYGKNLPIADNKTEEGRQQNRRVEAKILSF